MAFDAGSIEGTLDLDLNPFTVALDEATARADEFDGKTFTAKLDLDSRGVSAELDKLKAQLDEFARKAATATAKVNVERKEFDTLLFDLRIFSVRSYSTKVKVDSLAAKAELDLLRLKLDETARTRIATIFVSSPGSGEAEGSLSRIQMIAGAIIILAPMISAALIGIIGAVGMLASAFVVAGVGVGAFAIAAVPAFEEISKAVKKGQEGIDALPPSLRGAAQAFKGLKDEVKTLQEIGSGVVGQTMAAGFNLLTSILKTLEPLMKPVSAALTQMFGIFQEFFGSSIWGNFISMVGQQIGPVLRDFATIGVSLIKTVIGITDAFMKLGGPIMDQLVKMFQDLATWASNLGTDPNFKRFIDLAVQSLPRVIEFVTQLVTFIMHLAMGLAPLGNLMMDVVNWCLKLVNSIPPDWMGAIVLGITAIVVAISGFGGPIMLVVVTIMAVVAAFQAAYDKIGWFHKAVDAVVDFFTHFGDRMREFGDYIVTGWNDMINQISTAWTGLWTSVGDFFSNIWQSIVSFFEDRTNAFKQTWVDAWNSVVSFFQDRWNAARDSAIAIWQAISDFFTSIWNGISSVATTVWNAITDYFQRLFQAHHELITQVWTAISNFFSTIWNAISSTAQTVWNAISSFFADRWAAFSTSWTNLWTTISNFFQTIWNAISSTAQSIWNAIAAFFTERWNVFSANWSNLWNTVSQFFTTIWNNISSTAQSIWNAIASFFTNAWNVLSNAWNTVWNAISTFFTNIWNGIKGQATTLWNAISSFFTGAWDAISTKWNQIWQGISDFFGRVWEGIKTTASSVWDGITGAVRTGVNNVIGVINTLKNGLNVVLKFLLIPVIPDIPGFATGGVLPDEVQMLAGGGSVGAGFKTNGPRAIVGEGNPRYPEYVIPTDPQHRSNAVALHQEAGTQLLAGGGVVGGGGYNPYGGGGGSSSVAAQTQTAQKQGLSTDPLGDVTGAISSAMKAFAAGPIGEIGKAVATKIGDAVKKKITDALAAAAAAIIGGSPGGGAAQWAPVILRVLAELGQPASLLAAVERRINFESGGNPNAINLTDSNARAGHPSQGLMQTIPSTFAAYAGPYVGLGITNPLANIYAGLNYALHRYGSIAAIDPLNRPSGYDSGGLLMPGMTLAINKTRKPERILDADQTAKFDSMVAGTVNGVSNDDVVSKLDDIANILLRTGTGATVNVHDQSGDPVETARRTALALRLG
ncbi:MAG TPA: transglycosylase SLT domain-containing protein [Verrucomicrobiae bacterium]|nr:transglycosylase SLT domain-containing protein [Verrucomicrobiae bacterium]